MIEFIDTLFNPVLAWLDNIITAIGSMRVPASRGLNVGSYLGPFAMLGAGWILFMTTGIFLGMVYVITFIVISYNGLYIKFKDSVKWW